MLLVCSRLKIHLGCWLRDYASVSQVWLVLLAAVYVSLDIIHSLVLLVQFFFTYGHAWICGWASWFLVGLVGWCLCIYVCFGSLA